MKNMKIHVIILACVITLGAALLGQRYFYQQRVADPLRASIAAVPGVSQSDVQISGGKRIISLKLDKGADLWSAYSAVQKLGQQHLGSSFGGVVVSDNRNHELTESFYRMHFYVQQAIATGLFTDMAAGIDSIAKQDNLTEHKVFVDQDHIYLQLSKGEHRLYEVIARPQLIPQTPDTTRGGTAV